MNPMQQFDVKTLIPLHIGGIDVSFTNSALFMTLSVVIGIGLLWFLLRCQSVIPNTGQSVAESFFRFIRSTAHDNIGADYYTYMPFLLSVFLMVFMGNFLGLFPYGFTFTSQLAPVGAFALLGLGVCICIGVKKRGLKWFQTFMPEGIPVILAPIVVPIEIISFIAKPFSLTVRLVMNMIVGHILLKILASFVYSSGVLGAVPLLFIGVLMIFELGIAFLQAYIYTVLTSIYLGEALHAD